METFELQGWRIEFDRESTVDVYSRIPIGGPEACGCVYCQNWAQTRELFLPQQWRELLNRLGIPLERETEVYQNFRGPSGLHAYAGWLHFVGRVLNDPGTQVKMDPLVIWFHERPALINDAFTGLPLVQLEFVTEIAWLSDIPEPEG